jgi:short subunit dehydrogenase-like uncharacterized protein
MSPTHRGDDTIAVYGATGHTGRLVAAELAKRGHSLVLGGRAATALAALAARLGTRTDVAAAELDDPQALRRLTGAASVVVNCAGPFARTGQPLAAAAAAQGCHYLGHAAEPLHIKRMFDTHSNAEVVVIPNMSFYGALADLLAATIATGISAIDEVVVAYAVTGWRMTPASKQTAGELGDLDQLTYRDGRHHLTPRQQRTGTFTYPAPLGPLPVIEDYPAGEVVTIPRHIRTRNVRVVMTTATFTEPTVFTSEDTTPDERARSAFTIAVHATSPTLTRTGWIRGTDIYGTGAAISAAAASQLTRGHRPAAIGALSPAEAFASVDILTALPGIEQGISS